MDNTPLESNRCCEHIAAAEELIETLPHYVSLDHPYVLHCHCCSAVFEVGMVGKSRFECESLIRLYMTCIGKNIKQIKELMQT